MILAVLSLGGISYALLQSLVVPALPEIQASLHIPGETTLAAGLGSSTWCRSSACGFTPWGGSTSTQRGSCS